MVDAVIFILIVLALSAMAIVYFITKNIDDL